MPHHWHALIVHHLGPASQDPELRRRVEALVQAVERSLTGGGAPDSETIVPPSTALGPAPTATWDPTGPEPLIERSRYHDQGELGVGGMGEVRRVHDTVLRRTLAMKIVGEAVLRRPQWLARFVEEAQATAQLEHPGIVPVHDLGRLPDGRLYYTMREVHGRGLDTVIAELHAASGDQGWDEALGWSLRRVVEALRRAAEAVGYAHQRGVLHRDLKPANIMLGDHGEVLVVDWGLAKVLGAGEATGEEPVVTDRSLQGGLRTRAGQAAGTPGYMPPEQRAGQIDQLGPQADVYALGVTLFEVLTGRRPGPEERDRVDLGAQLDALPRARRVPSELRAACLRALELDPADRFPDATEFGAALQAWLEGARRSERARGLVERAAAHLPEAEQLLAESVRLTAQARGVLDALPLNAPIEAKRPGWALEDKAARLRSEAERAEQAFLLGVQSALEVQPDLPEAHRQLAAHYRARHEAAEAARDTAAAARFAHMLRRHDDGSHEAYLTGDGALTLLTDVPARAVLYRFVTRDRHLVPMRIADLGTTPLEGLALRMGSYLVELSAPGRETVRYPFTIRRGEHWMAVPPGGAAVAPVVLPVAGSVGPREAYIAAGPFQCGGDPGAAVSLAARDLWLDAFCMRRFPVTNAEYVTFLDDLVDQGREAEAIQHAPREKGGRIGTQGRVIYGRDAKGHFRIGRDADGDLWLPDGPVVMVNWAGAAAYAAWLAERTGLPWRLPFEVEWEKAARGVDGRIYPWGDSVDPSWVVVRDFHPDAPVLPPIGTAPLDESPYGVRDVAGGVRDWCADPYSLDGPRFDEEGRMLPYPDQSGVPMRSDRGGSWCESIRSSRVACRDSDNPLVRSSMRGFRVCRSL